MAGSKRRFGFLAAMRLGETPVPIPNTMVKPQAADGTALETMWESRWPPDSKEKKTEFGETSKRLDPKGMKRALERV